MADVDDQMLVYPTDKVVGVVPDRATLDSVWEALRSAGVEEGRIEAFGGEQAPDDGRAGSGPDAPVDEEGTIASVVRTVRTALGEEATRLQGLNEAIEAGSFVVQVEIPDLDDGDAKNAEKRSVGNALHDGGAGDVAFYGSLAIEELQLGA